MSESNENIANRPSKLLLIAVAVISIAIGVWASQSLFRKPATIPQNLQATLLDTAKPLTAFKLVDHNNNPFNLHTLKGKWTFLFFGYTHCPDVCPTALQLMRSVWKMPQLQPAISSNLKMVFISVDPERDTPAILQSYVKYYNLEFIGVTGKLDEIDKLTNQIGVLYGFDEPNENGDYNVSHSGQIILIDPQANMRAVFSPPLTSQSIADDFLAIKKYVEDRQ